MRAGRLRHLVTIQTLSEVNAEGATSNTWANTTTVYAAIEPMKSDEKAQYKAIAGETYFKIRMRYYDLDSITNRITFDGVTYHLKSVINTGLRNIETVCDAVTRQGD